jgi:hypothetical protein
VKVGEALVMLVEMRELSGPEVSLLWEKDSCVDCDSAIEMMLDSPKSLSSERSRVGGESGISITAAGAGPVL